MGTITELMSSLDFAPADVYHNLAQKPDAGGGYSNPGFELPNIPVSKPPVADDVTTVVGWLKWGALVAGVVGLIICAIMMMIGRRSRSQTAVEGATGIPWVLAGLTLVAASTGLVKQFF